MIERYVNDEFSASDKNFSNGNNRRLVSILKLNLKIN